MFFMFFQLSEKVCDVIKSDRICVTVGGDHSIGLGTVFGHAKAYPEEVFTFESLTQKRHTGSKSWGGMVVDVFPTILCRGSKKSSRLGTPFLCFTFIAFLLVNFLKISLGCDLFILPLLLCATMLSSFYGLNC